MKNRRLILFTFCGLCCFPSLLVAQFQSHCGVSELSILRSEVTDYRSYPRAEISIPVVFHIVYNQSQENLSNAKIIEQLGIINEDFNAANKDLNLVPDIFKKSIGNAAINFCLASMDPFGNPAEGIVRVQTNLSNIGNASNVRDGKRFVQYSEFGGSDAWDPAFYLNIWIAARSDEIIGEASFPSIEDPSRSDGIILRYDVVGTSSNPLNNFNKGRTLTHEIGHYLNLNHPWGSDTGCFGDDDYVKDTPKQEGPYFGCERNAVYSCGSRDMDNNFMNFRNDECLNFFSKGQVERMIDALFTFRRNLISSKICSQEMALPPDPLKVLNIDFRVDYLSFNLSGLTSGEFTLALYDIQGRKVWTGTNSSSNQFRIEHPHLQSGIYILSLTNKELFFSRKIFVP